jgi:16S rRNA (uracil1498-N3)-methyltransferase
MRQFRCYHPTKLNIGERYLLEQEESRHLVSVRRIREGHQAIVINGMGQEVLATVTSIGKRECELEVTEVLRQEKECPHQRVLCCALTKSSHYDEMILRCVELGMTTFQPIITERTVVEWPEKKAEKKLERWNRICIEALKQCERLWLPEIKIPITLNDALSKSESDETTPVFLTERSTDTIPLSTWKQTESTAPLALFVGPEGGWTEEEMEHARSSKAIMATLGHEAILRTETAVLAGMAILM